MRNKFIGGLIMKRILAFLMIAFMLLSLASCSGGKSAKAITVSDGMIWEYECVEHSKITTLSAKCSFLDDDTSCVITGEQVMFLEKDGDSYVITKVILKETVSGKNADEYKNSLDPEDEEDADELKMLSDGGLVLEGKALKEYGLDSDARVSLKCDFAKDRLLSFEMRRGNYIDREEFIFDKSGKQTGVETHSTYDGDEYEYTITFTEFHSNGVLKTAKLDYGDGDTGTYKFNDKGLMEDYE